MLTFTDHVDARCREPAKPTVAKLLNSADPKDVKYIVVGTQYGYLHTTGGDIRYWRSYSGARRVARNYEPF